MSSPPLPFSRQSARTGDSPISYFMQQAVENPSLISLAAGLVDEPSLPSEEMAAAVADVLSDPRTARAALQYGTTPGLAAMRERVLNLVCQADDVTPGELNLTSDDVVLTNGSQQLLYLLSEAILDEGDIVITEAPSYFVYHGVLKSMGVRVVSVPMDEEGMLTEALEEKLSQLEKRGELNRLKLIYTVDYFQNPSGLTLSLPRRQHLVELARRFSREHRLLILEDAAYRELRFAGPDLPSVKCFDESNEYVVSTYTFSKPCAPGLKTGYGLMPRELARAVVRLKGNHDFGSNNFSQHVLMRLLDSGAYHRHVERLRKRYLFKRDLMISALEREFADCEGVSWTRPDGGLYVWFRLPEHMSTSPESDFADAALREGVLYVPGEFGHVGEDEPAPNWEARLTYGVVDDEDIPEGVRRLRQAYDAAGKAPSLSVKPQLSRS